MAAHCLSKYDTEHTGLTDLLGTPYSIYPNPRPPSISHLGVCAVNSGLTPSASISVHLGRPVSSTLPCPQCAHACSVDVVGPIASFARRRRAKRAKSRSATSKKPTATPTAMPAFAPAVSAEDAAGGFCVEVDEGSVGEGDGLDSDVELVGGVVWLAATNLAFGSANSIALGALGCWPSRMMTENPDVCSVKLDVQSSCHSHCQMLA